MDQRTASTPYAILGLLGFAPMSGYDIRKEAATSIGYFWSESYGQIYPTLRKLQTAGWIRRRPGRRGGGRERQVYEITAHGRAALRSWLAVPPRAAPVRNELLLKLFLGDASLVSRDVEWVEEHLAKATDHVRQFRRIRCQLQDERRDHPSLPFWLMTLGYGEHWSRSTARWCRETLRALREAAREHGKESNRGD